MTNYNYTVQSQSSGKKVKVEAEGAHEAAVLGARLLWGVKRNFNHPVVVNELDEAGYLGRYHGTLWVETDDFVYADE